MAERDLTRVIDAPMFVPSLETKKDKEKILEVSRKYGHIGRLPVRFWLGKICVKEKLEERKIKVRYLPDEYERLRHFYQRIETKVLLGLNKIRLYHPR